MKRYLPPVVILLLIAVFPMLSGEKSAYYCTVLVFVGIYVILAMSLDLLVGYAGQISVGHAAFFAIGAYTSAILSTKVEVPPLFALVAGVLVSGLIAWIIGWSVLALKGYYLAMATFALNAIVYTLIIGLQGLTGGATGLRDIPHFSILGIAIDSHITYYYLVWAVVLLVLASCLTIVRSPFGRTIIAIHGDDVAASTVGVNCAGYKISVFVLSSVYAAIAGSLFAHYMGFISPDDFNVSTSVSILVMVYLGGVGTIYGPALGAVFLKILPEVTYVFHDYELLINGLILIAVLIFMPGGLMGIFSLIERKLGYATLSCNLP